MMAENGVGNKRHLNSETNHSESKHFRRESDDKIKPLTLKPTQVCPYLDTINRNILDFDFEKLCSVSLSRINVYACLVCGKYFQGRGKSTHAYTHSVSEGHHVYLNLLTLKFYCLPDNYEVIDSSLGDILFVLKPTFTKESIKALETSTKHSRAYDGTTYRPGVFGLNNIKANDYCNVILQALSHIPPIRNYFLFEENYSKIQRPPGDILPLLTQRFGELLRKLWNDRVFKAHVSPHEMLQAVVYCSKKKFQITKQGDPVAFMSWFLNTLHLALNGTKKKDSSIIYQTFQGKMKIYSRRIPHTELTNKQKEELLQTEEYKEKTEESTFLYLSSDLPAPPLFKDEMKENIIPQVSLYTLLNKFDGQQEKEYKTYKDLFKKRFEITSLPPIIILCIQRFSKNTFFVEKNPTIVNFPISNIDFGDILTEEVKLKHEKEGKSVVYDLLCNIVHDGNPETGTYKIHLLHKASGKWYEIQDLMVKEVLPQMITLTEAYIQVYERRKL